MVISLAGCRPVSTKVVDGRLYVALNVIVVRYNESRLIEILKEREIDGHCLAEALAYAGDMVEQMFRVIKDRAYYTPGRGFVLTCWRGEWKELEEELRELWKVRSEGAEFESCSPLQARDIVEVLKEGLEAGDYIDVRTVRVYVLADAAAEDLMAVVMQALKRAHEERERGEEQVHRKDARFMTNILKFMAKRGYVTNEKLLKFLAIDKEFGQV